MMGNYDCPQNGLEVILGIKRDLY